MKSAKAFKVISIFLIIAAALIVIVTVKQNRQNTQLSDTNNTEVQEAVKLEIFTPKAFVQTPNTSEWIEATSEQEVADGTKIKTDAGGKVQIVYPNGSVTRLAENTEITLKIEGKEEKQVTISLTAGKIWSRITKLLGAETYETESENLVASIRGTSYGHEILASGEDVVTVTKSAVLGKCKNKNIESQVNRDYKGVFNCKKGFRPRLTRIALIEKLQNWHKHNEEEDKKQIERFGRERFDDIIEEILSSYSPRPIVKPSPSPSPKLSPSPNSTPSPTPTVSSPSPSPTPLPTITSISTSQSCYNYSPCTVIVNGNGLDKVTQAYAVSSDGKTTIQVTIQSQSEGRITVSYNGQSGKFYIKVINSYGGNATSPNTFDVIYFG